MAASTTPISYSAFVNKFVVSDGALFQMSGSTFSLQIFKNGSATPITSFNGNTSFEKPEFLEN
jgi:hypothetical protein